MVAAWIRLDGQWRPVCPCGQWVRSFQIFKTKNLDRLHWGNVGFLQEAICFETLCVDLTPASWRTGPARCRETKVTADFQCHRVRGRVRGPRSFDALLQWKLQAWRLKVKNRSLVLGDVFITWSSCILLMALTLTLVRAAACSGDKRWNPMFLCKQVKVMKLSVYCTSVPNPAPPYSFCNACSLDHPLVRKIASATFRIPR